MFLVTRTSGNFIEQKQAVLLLAKIFISMICIPNLNCVFLTNWYYRMHFGFFVTQQGIKRNNEIIISDACVNMLTAKAGSACLAVNA